MQININSEIGELEGVILHTPGGEVENMNPKNAARALYSDILNLSVVLNEYRQFYDVMKKLTKVFEVRELFTEIMKNEKVKEKLVTKICKNENAECLIPILLDIPVEDLVIQLIEGVPRIKNTLSNFLADEKYMLPPMHNFFYTRDSAIAIRNNVFIGKMAGKVRERESLIMNAIFEYCSRFNGKVIVPPRNENIVLEGGDIHVAREDILLAGFGCRTSTQGIDSIIEKLRENKDKIHIIAQQLPTELESYIHLDMLFTILDRDTCMVFPPIINESSPFKTIEITIDNGHVKSIKEEKSILTALKKHGMDLKPVFCGGNNTSAQEREQWHSGANFFALSPGVVIGYERNIYTINALSKAGFDIVKAEDIIADKKEIIKGKKTVITIAGSELSRGGGGCRCMTMPISRKDI